METKDIGEVLDMFEKVAVDAVKKALVYAGQDATDQGALNIITKIGLRQSFGKDATEEFLVRKSQKETTKN